MRAISSNQESIGKAGGEKHITSYQANQQSQAWKRYLNAVRRRVVLIMAMIRKAQVIVCSAPKSSNADWPYWLLPIENMLYVSL